MIGTNKREQGENEPMKDAKLTRKQVLGGILAAAAGAGMKEESAMADTKESEPIAEAGASSITLEDLVASERIANIAFTPEDRLESLKSVQGAADGFAKLRKTVVPYTIESSASFAPLIKPKSGKATVRATVSPAKESSLSGLPEVDIAFLSVRELSRLIKTRKLSPVELTRIYLDRLKRYGDKLLCVVTLTESLALKQAERAEKEIAAGRYLGPLHGIPYGLKDLFATKGIPTTWGAEPYKDQIFDYDATVVKKLEAAGAVLVAKLSMGALAQGDVWFRGLTKNPWNLAEGSSGSSAGPASATSAGLVGFSIGTETLGSIVSPSVRCRVTGLRPTYGRVSRAGAMGLSYTMDKVGPICREAEDCALVFAAICGSDPDDRTAQDASFLWKPRMDWKRMKIGLLVNTQEETQNRDSIEKDPMFQHLQSLGAQVSPVKFTSAPNELYKILEVESASAFDDFTLSPDIRKLKESTWPETFRSARYVPAVEYLRAQRVRTQVMRRFEQELGDLDLYVSYGGGWQTLALTNFTGHPQVVIPTGADEKNESMARSFIGRLYQDDKLLAVAREVQNTMDFHRRRPDLSKA